MMQSILLVTVALCLAVTFIMLEGFKMFDHGTETFIAIIICMLLQLSMLAFILGV